MIWKTWGISGRLLVIITSIGLFLSGCIGAVRFTEQPEVTETEAPTPFPPTWTPMSTSTPTSSPTPTETLIPTPTPHPDSLLIPTPELAKVVEVPVGGYSFREPLGYQVSVTDGQVNIVNDGIVISLIGIRQEHGPVEEVLDSLLKQLGEQFEDLTVSDAYSTPIDGAEGLTAPIRGSLAGDKLSGLASAISISQEQLFYIIALVPDGPDGPAWDVTGRPVLETLIETIDFFPPVVGQ